MEILISDKLSKKINNQKLEYQIFKKIKKEMKHLKQANDHGYISLRGYLKSKNGKALKGSKRNQPTMYKYRLSDGDRLFYVFRKDNNTEQMIVSDYTTHKKQGLQGLRTTDWDRQKAVTIDEVLGSFEAFDEEDLEFLDIHSEEELDARIEGYILHSKNFHEEFVVSDEEMINNENADVMNITEDKKIFIENYLKNPQMTFLSGGAGTGKTLVSLHLLNDIFHENEEDMKCAYFTQSEALLYKAKKDYKKISGNENEKNLYFCDINAYCFRILDKLNYPIRSDKYVMTQTFLRFFHDNKNKEFQRKTKKLGLSEMNVWTEIRGVIKGSMSREWLRNQTQNALDWNKETIEELLEKGVIERDKSNEQKIRLSESHEQKNAEELSKEARETYNELKTYYKHVDFDVEELELDCYCSPTLSCISPVTLSRNCQTFCQYDA